jgi:NAD(P)-dependent dehydrogenase (short-subunit alcohol dehydrogenase family)
MLQPSLWCQPLHDIPEGPTDPSNTELPNPFVVVVLGATRGIGQGIATAYAKAGASALAIGGRDLNLLEQRAGELKKMNPNLIVKSFKCDVTSETEVAAAAELIRSTFGRLDVLVFNPGTAPKLEKQANGLLDWPFGFINAPISEFRRVMELNALAPFVVSHYFLPLLEESKDGAQSLVLVSSAASFYTDPKVMNATYSLSKLTATRMIEHIHEAHKDAGILAYAVQPGGVKTDLAQEIPEGKGWEDSKLVYHPFPFIDTDFE